MRKELDFDTFAKLVATYELNNSKCVTSAHHSNGSGKDWEAFQREVRVAQEQRSSGDTDQLP